MEDDSIDVTGPPNDTLFHDFGATVWLRDDALERWGQAVTKLFRHLEVTEDVRALVVVGALAVEYSVDQVLLGLLPGYKALQDNRDFTFSVKIASVRAARILPFRVLADADHIRAIRNAFAHNLEVSRFEQLDSRHSASLATRLNQYQRPIAQPPTAMYRDLCLDVSVALLGYAERARAATQALWSTEGKRL